MIILFFLLINLKTSSKRYHYDAKQNKRNAKAEKLTRSFVWVERGDRENIKDVIGEMPSPRNTTWSWYIKHRLRMMNIGIETYTTCTYARLQLDKHIEWHRAIDTLAYKLTRGKPSIIYMGAGQIAANSPISIRKHVRCPGTRKLIGAFKKLGNCVVRMVDEFKTSQMCARCFRPFPRITKSYRFKKCDNCVPNPDLRLPTLIVTDVSKRVLQMRRTIMKMWQEMGDMGDAIAASLTQSNTGRLVSKKQRFQKTWQPNANVNDEEDLLSMESSDQQQTVLKTVWHRDIAAAKLILYKGEFYEH